MASKDDNKKTALKLINKYADSYNILEEENKSLRSEVIDLKSNLMINKQIIESFFNSGSKNDKNTMYITKLKEENFKLIGQIEKISKERKELREKVFEVYNLKLTFIDQTLTESFNRVKEENEKSKNKIFVMDNTLIKKDSIIIGLKKKLEKNYHDLMNNKSLEKEIYVIEPTIANTQINDELLMYKQIYNNLVTDIKEKDENLIRYNEVINDLQNENSKMRTKIKFHEIREKNLNKDLNPEQNYVKSRSSSTNVASRKSSNNNQMMIPVLNVNVLKKDLNQEGDSINSNLSRKSFNIHKDEGEEWDEILKFSGLTPEDLDKMSKNKKFSKFSEAIEMLNRLLCDKNLQIRLLEKENEYLNEKNNTLNKENISLSQQCLELKKELQRIITSNVSFKSVIENGKTIESCMINKSAKITFDNLNLNEENLEKREKNYKPEEIKIQSNPKSQWNYFNKININECEENSFDNCEIEHLGNTNINESKNLDINVSNNNKINSDEESSGHDSIIYTKDPNIKMLRKNNKPNSNLKNIKIDTLDFCTSNDFKAALDFCEESFISKGNDDIRNLKIDIKNSNL